jgi:hypothetical protein
MLENKVLRRIFGSRIVKKQGSGENYMRSSTSCALDLILLELLNQEVGDEWGI